MKNSYILLLALFVFTYSNAQIVDIPDEIFKNMLVNFPVVDTDGDGIGDIDVDTNDDGEIQVSEAEATLSIYLPAANIISLEGISSFVNLEYLKCAGGQQLASIDVTNNSNLIYLNLFGNQLTNINVTQNSNLEYLDINVNQVSSIDVTQNPNLKNFYCSDNPISIIDVTQNPLLERLTTAGANITNLDVTQNPNLTGLFCYYNQLTSIDVSQNPNLEQFWCYHNQIVSVDVSQNSNLVDFRCQENDLINLNVKNGNNINMTLVFAYDNPNLMCILIDDETATYPACNPDPPYSGWCKDEWAEYSEECELGLDDFTFTDFTLYPNPAQDILNIETQQQIETVKIYNLQGQLIKEVSTNSIDVSNLNTGLYFVQVTVDGKSITKKFIKE